MACINEGYVWMDGVTNAWSWNQQKMYEHRDRVKRDSSAKKLQVCPHLLKPIWLVQNGETANVEKLTDHPFQYNKMAPKWQKSPCW